MTYKTIRICLSLLAAPVLLLGNIQRELEEFFDTLSSSSNVTSAEIYQGQKAGYATGGGATVRNRSTHTHPTVINMPHIDAGCGGIDIYTGSFSFINSDQLIQTLKSIGSSSISYAFLLGLETVSPQVANPIKQLQSWANTINAMSINSCEVASQLVGAVWPKDSVASEHICQSLGTHYGDFTDRVASRHQCSTRQDRKAQAKQGEEGYANISTDYNTTWEALKKQGFLSKDAEVAEFFMTLMGTIIVTDGGIDLRPAKASEETFVKALLEGGSVSVYTCDNKDRCLVIKDATQTIDKKNSWGGRIEALLLSIQEKIVRDEELAQEERELLVKTHLPLYRFINVLTAYKKGICPIDLKQVSDIVSMDVLVQYLRDVLDNVRTACMHFRHTVGYADKIDEYLASLQLVEGSIRQYEHRSAFLMDQEVYILEKMRLLEEQIASELLF